MWREKQRESPHIDGERVEAEGRGVIGYRYRYSRSVRMWVLLLVKEREGLRAVLGKVGNTGAKGIA